MIVEGKVVAFGLLLRPFLSKAGKAGIGWATLVVWCGVVTGDDDARSPKVLSLYC